jgi:hypothetical protein
MLACKVSGNGLVAPRLTASFGKSPSFARTHMMILKILELSYDQLCWNMRMKSIRNLPEKKKTHTIDETSISFETYADSHEVQMRTAENACNDKHKLHIYRS